MNRTFATKQKDWLDENPDQAAVNVLTLLRKLDKLVPNLSAHYDVLSEICHPNALGHNFMFGKLDRQTGIVDLSDGLDRAELHFTRVFPAFLLIGLVEKALDRIDNLLPAIVRLSDAAREIDNRR